MDRQVVARRDCIASPRAEDKSADSGGAVPALTNTDSGSGETTVKSRGAVNPITGFAQFNSFLCSDQIRF